jgi:hypothetical protein
MGGVAALAFTGLTAVPAAFAAKSRQVFPVTATARVELQNPRSNLAGQELLAGGASESVRTYLKFDVSGLRGRVVSARLSIVPLNASAGGFSVHAVSSSPWEEDLITWRTAPAMEPEAIASSGRYKCALRCHVKVRLPGAIGREGTYTFALTSTASPPDGYGSATEGRAARLLLTVEPGSEPSPSPEPEPSPSPEPEPTPEGKRGLSWAPVGSPPLSDSAAAALVESAPEQRPGNATANSYVPSSSELEAFHKASAGNPLDANVDGLDGLTHPSTDELIQWAAYKWGIPLDWLRAEYVVESGWKQSQLGDRRSVPSSWYTLYPPQARIAGSSEVYESMGISQIKWVPDGSVGAGTEPLRWKSTAFNVDYQAATVRYYFEGDCTWCGSGYGSGQAWNSIGAWFSPSPWGNAGAVSYISQVQRNLSARPWLSPTF